MAVPEKIPWKRIKIDFISGFTIDEISSKYNIPYHTIAKKMKSEAWRRIASLDEVLEAISKAMVTSKSELIVLKAAEILFKHYRAMEEKGETNITVNTGIQSVVINRNIIRKNE